MRGVLIASLYAPNGNPQPGPKFDYKLAWLERLASMPRRCAAAARRSCWPATSTSRRPISTSIRRNPGTTTRWSIPTAAPRSAGSSAAGLDRCAAPAASRGTVYTFWDYRRKRWPRDAGLRLDHLLLSPNLAGRLVAGGVDREVRGLEGASDHAPAWIELAAEKN